MPHLPQEDHSTQLIVSPELAEALADRRKARDAALAASGIPVEGKSPFITHAEFEKQNARAAQKVHRGRISHAARIKIAARRESIPDFERHSRKCQLCRHPEVDRIEDLFVNWSSSSEICKIFKISGIDAVYRHARATGLDVVRRQNARFAVEKLIEDVDRVTVTSSTVLRAVRALSCIDEKGHWTDLPSTHIVVRGTDGGTDVGTDAAFSNSGAPDQGIAPSTSISNRLIYEELETPITYTKEGADTDSNR